MRSAGVLVTDFDAASGERHTLREQAPPAAVEAFVQPVRTRFQDALSPGKQRAARQSIEKVLALLEKQILALDTAITGLIASDDVWKTKAICDQRSSLSQVRWDKRRYPHVR